MEFVEIMSLLKLQHLSEKDLKEEDGKLDCVSACVITKPTLVYVCKVRCKVFNRPSYQMQPNELKRTIPANEQRKIYETEAAVNGKELKD